MASRSPTLESLDKDGRVALEKRLLDRQSGKCFICDETIDLMLHQGELEVDHIVPLADDGPDEENNFAIAHPSCNESKGSSDLRVARRMAELAPPVVGSDPANCLIYQYMEGMKGVV